MKNSNRNDTSKKLYDNTQKSVKLEELVSKATILVDVYGEYTGQAYTRRYQSNDLDLEIVLGDDLPGNDWLVVRYKKQSVLVVKGTDSQEPTLERFIYGDWINLINSKD